MIKATYKASVTKDGAFWYIQFPSHENVFTQARNLDEIESMTRDAFSLIFEIPKDSFDLEFNFGFPEKSLSKML